MRSRLAVAMFCVFAGACSDSVGPRADDQIIFISAPVATPNDKDIYVMNADGTGQENLTEVPADYYLLSLSPDGRRLAFTSTREPCIGVWAMNVDGSALRNLTAGASSDVGCNRMPRWSPDGSKIAFSTTRDGTYSVYVMNADGSNPVNVYSPVDGQNWPYSWSPDGRVVLLRYVSGVLPEASIVNSDGTGRQPLFGRTGDRSPAWSPDGSKVAFIRDAGGSASVWVMNSDGSNLRRLTDHAGSDELRDYWGNEYSPWSPDGTRIAFTNSTGSGIYAVYVIRADGSGLSRLTDPRAGTQFNGWSPDGRVTFTSTAAGTSDVYLIDPDGTGQINLTNTSDSNESGALWLPRP